MATLPALSLHQEIQHPYSQANGYRIKLFRNHRTLLISKRSVVVITGAVVFKRLQYDDPVISAAYTSFSDTQRQNEDCTLAEEALVVCLAKAAHIYYSDGRTYMVSFPFNVRQAEPFEHGIILEKEADTMSLMDSSPTAAAIAASQAPQFTHSRFLTLVDPMGDFRAVTKSSTSVIGSHETIVYYPSSMKKLSLCATFNPHDGTITIYHIRNSVRTRSRATGIVKKRKHVLISTPNSSRILEDEPEMLAQSSVNMEKKRTSTLLSEASSMARIVTTSEFTDRKSGPSLRKDMILTKVESVMAVASTDRIKVCGLADSDFEAVVVMNRAKHTATVYAYRLPVMSTGSPTVTTIECIDCFVYNSSSSYLLVATDPHTFHLINPFVDIRSPPFHVTKPITRIVGSCDDTVMFKSGKEVSAITLTLSPTSNVLKRCLSAFQYLAGANISDTVAMLWRSATMMSRTNDEWEAFVITMLAIILPENGVMEHTPITRLLPQARKLSEEYPFNYQLGDLLPFITVALHLIREDTRLDMLASEDTARLGQLLAQLTEWMGWPSMWTKYYFVEHVDHQVRFLSSELFETPPNIFESLTSVFGDRVHYTMFSHLTEESDGVNMEIIPRTAKVLRLFELFANDYGANAIVEAMADMGLTSGDLDMYPAGVVLPLKEALSVCQENPAFEWTNPALQLIDRPDIMGLSSLNPQTNPTYHKRGDQKPISHLLGSVLSDDVGVISPWDGQAEADRMGITKLMFDYDRRYFEITSLLHQTKTQTAHLEVEEGVAEYALVVLQRELARIVALRTLTIPVGRAALFYSGRTPMVTEKFPIAKFNLTTLVTPTMTNIVLADDAVPSLIMDWGNFHNGVSAGLSISTEAKGINGSWIIFNKPPDLNAQHAGFLLGLGLNGHLRKLEEWHIYNYLGPKHPLTSVGLLLGMAASLRGTMDNKLTKVLSVHALALLPRGANDLNVPVNVQSAGLVGIGLLYLESQHRRMSEILLSQIMGYVHQNGQKTIHEGYRLSAGIALGLVNLAKGNDLRGLNDTHVVDRLMVVATAMKDFQVAEELDKSCAGAIIAIAFIYLQTNDRTIAAKLEVPATEQLLDYVRPDLLLLRCLARHLIMWDSIGNSVTWVKSQLPAGIQGRYELNSDYLAYFNLIGGTCMAMAVRYASTHDPGARDTLLHFMEAMMAMTAITPNNYDQRIAHQGALAVQVLLGLGLAVIMAGSGDLATLRRLRAMYHDTSVNMSYGTYLGTNLALGFLFLGGGQYAVANTPFAVANIVIALYPVFSSRPDEGDIHLEALRYFWALAVEPRCLVVRDVATNKPCKVPVKITTRDGEVKRLVSPCLVPTFNNLHSLATESADYFGVEVDFSLQSAYLDRFKQTKTLYVTKRRNYSSLLPTISRLLSVANKSLQADTGDPSPWPSRFKFDIYSHVDTFAKQALVFEDSDNDSRGLSLWNIIDDKLDWYHRARKPRVDDIWNLKLMLAFANHHLANEEGLHYVSNRFICHLRETMWTLAAPSSGSE